MRQYMYKVPGGKLLKIKIDLEDGTEKRIKNISILGDFFLHPEESISKIEEVLINAEQKDVLQRLTDVVKSEKITILGFSPQDLADLISKAFEGEGQ